MKLIPAIIAAAIIVLALTVRPTIPRPNVIEQACECTEEGATMPTPARDVGNMPPMDWKH